MLRTKLFKFYTFRAPYLQAEAQSTTTCSRQILSHTDARTTTHRKKSSGVRDAILFLSPYFADSCGIRFNRCRMTSLLVS